MAETLPLSGNSAHVRYRDDALIEVQVVTVTPHSRLTVSHVTGEPLRVVFDAKGGGVLWQNQDIGWLIGSEGATAFTVEEKGIAARSAADGKLLWQSKVEGECIVAEASGQLVVARTASLDRIAAHEKDSLVFLDPATGKEAGRVTVPTPVSCPVRVGPFLVWRSHTHAKPKDTLTAVLRKIGGIQEYDPGITYQPVIFDTRTRTFEVLPINDLFRVFALDDDRVLLSEGLGRNYRVKLMSLSGRKPLWEVERDSEPTDVKLWGETLVILDSSGVEKRSLDTGIVESTFEIHDPQFGGKREWVWGTGGSSTNRYANVPFAVSLKTGKRRDLRDDSDVRGTLVALGFGVMFYRVTSAGLEVSRP